MESTIYGRDLFKQCLHLEVANMVNMEPEGNIQSVLQIITASTHLHINTPVYFIISLHHIPAYILIHNNQAH